MALQVIPQTIPEVKLVIPDVFGDTRGFFQETFKAEKYRAAGIVADFMQDNWSRSVKGTLRGLHYQLPNPQDKLVWAVRGEIYDVAVDIRFGSPTFGRWISEILSARNKKQLYVPVGFAHGFCVLSEEAEFLYYCTDYYHPHGERGIIWNDPDLAIPWPASEPLLSAKDRSNPRLRDIARDFTYSP